MGKKRINGEGTFYHDEKRGIWQYRLVLGYDEDGKPIRKAFYGKSQQEAKKKGETALNELNGQTVSVSPDTKLGDWIKLYLENYKKGTIQANWYKQLTAFTRNIPKSLLNKKMSAIAPVELQKLINDLSGVRSQGYVEKIRILLKSAFTEAQENGIIAKNPARKLTVPQKPEKPREVYTANEAATIIEYAKSYHNKTIGAAVCTLLLTGIRRGEMLGLKWSDIDGDTLHIRRGVYMDSKTPTAEEYRAKTYGSIRDVPYLPELASVIDSLPQTSEFIFPNIKGGLIDPHNFNRAYFKLLDLARKEHPEVRRLSPHCCRHTYATLTLSAGANLRNVQTLLGHADPKTTARYTHPDNAELQASARSMVSHLYAIKYANHEQPPTADTRQSIDITTPQA